MGIWKTMKNKFKTRHLHHIKKYNLCIIALFLFCIFSFSQSTVFAQGIINTIAGKQEVGFSGDGGPATEASLNFAWGVVEDESGNIFITDARNNRVRKIDTQGNISSFVTDANNVSLKHPIGIDIDGVGNLFVADTSNHRILKIDSSSGFAIIVAGNGEGDFSGDGGFAHKASINNPRDVAVDSVGNIYIPGSNRIRKVDLSGTINTIVGTSTQGYNGDNKPLLETFLKLPSGITVDNSDNIIFADSGNHRIRRVILSENKIETIAGNGVAGFSGDGGNANNASLNSPGDVYVDTIGNIFVIDNHRVRKIDTSNIITTVVGGGEAEIVRDGVSATSVELSPNGIFMNKNNDILIANTNRIFKVGPPLPPNADFSANKTTGNSTILQVQFSDKSTGSINSWKWDFGDGNTSTEQEPSHVYRKSGNYTVSLTVSGTAGTATEIKQDFISLIGAPVVVFTSDVNSGAAPLKVNFTDQSRGIIDSWAWDFGDGQTDSQQHPSHTYNNAGVFGVSLTVTGSGGSTTETKSGFITVTEQTVKPVARFTADKIAGVAPFTVNFIDQSTGSIDTWSWNFGDGGISSIRNPSNTYDKVGLYTVSLTVSGSDGSSTETKTRFINVSDQNAAIAADFTADKVNGPTPLEVNFKDQSSGIINEWLWNFGDSNTSVLTNPSHIYTLTGIFAVSLTVTGTNASDTEVKNNFITTQSIEPAPTANFTSNVTSGPVPLTVNFIDSSTGVIETWFWDFGDGGVNVVSSPSYTYKNTGVFTVTLTVKGPGGSDVETKPAFIRTKDVNQLSDIISATIAPLENGNVDVSDDFNKIRLELKGIEGLAPADIYVQAFDSTEGFAKSQSRLMAGTSLITDENANITETEPEVYKGEFSLNPFLESKAVNVWAVLSKTVPQNETDWFNGVVSNSLNVDNTPPAVNPVAVYVAVKNELIVSFDDGMNSSSMRNEGSFPDIKNMTGGSPLNISMLKSVSSDKKSVTYLLLQKPNEVDTYIANFNSNVTDDAGNSIDDVDSIGVDMAEFRNEPVLPPAPTGFNVEPGDGKATITWNSVPGADSYTIYMATINWNIWSKDLPNAQKQDSIKSSNFTQEGLINDIVYIFAVAAVVNGTEGLQSDQIGVKPVKTTAPDVTPEPVKTITPTPEPVKTLTPTPTPTPEPAITETITPSPTPKPEIKPAKITANPKSGKKSLKFQKTIITVLDQNGNAMKDVAVTAATQGRRVFVNPGFAKTGADGTAEFSFRFGILSKNGEITFSADGVETAVVQE